LGDGPERVTVYSPEREETALKLARRKLFILWQMTSPGEPSLYDEDTAQLPEGEESPGDEVIEYYQILLGLRNHYDVLRNGAWEVLHDGGAAYAYLRAIEDGRDSFGQAGEDNVAVVLLNRDGEGEALFDLDLSRWHVEKLVDPLDDYNEVPLQEKRLRISLDPLQGRLLLRDRWKANRQVRRESGILFHPASLPSSGGIGDLGAEAYSFMDFLEAAGQGYWQVLPLNPPAAGNSPYQCFSAFAGDPLLIDLRKLAEEGLLRQEELEKLPPLPARTVDFASVKEQKGKMLRLAFTRFSEADGVYGEFCARYEHWLPDFALFMALKEHFGGRPWNQWERDAAFRLEETLNRYRELLVVEMGYHKFLQFIFFRQWLALKDYAHSRGIKIIGDLPLFVAHDSSDVWSKPHLFRLDAEGNPQVIAGVPPDYFSKTGQLWGNPHYCWDVMENDGFQWWKGRLRLLMELVDLVRIDHFLGLEHYWEIPAGATTAEEGRWVKGPGEKFFQSLREELGELPLIAEDLGLVTPAVKRLKQRLNLPGMHVLQFMVEPCEGAKLNLPLYERNTVLYTGTHDNDTLLGWYRSAAIPCTTIGSDTRKKEVWAAPPDWGEKDACRHFIEAALRSDAAMVIIPLQDILLLDSSARMNIPGTVEGNWQWRLRGDELTATVAGELRALTEKHHRRTFGKG